MTGPRAVTLSPLEMLVASTLGSAHSIRALRTGATDRSGAVEGDGRRAEGDHWRRRIEGACGELAVAKALDIFYGGATWQHGRGDVGPLQVRTRSRHDFDLLVQEQDHGADRFVLVTGAAPVFHLRGWCFGADAKQPAYLRRHGGMRAAYFVPPNHLRPMADLDLARVGA